MSLIKLFLLWLIFSHIILFYIARAIFEYMSATVLNTLLTLTHLILVITSKVLQNPHSTGEEIQVQNGEETYPPVSNKFRREKV